MFDFLSDIGEAVSDGVGAAVDAVTDGVSTAVDAVTDGVSTAVDTVTDGVDTAGRAISRGLDAVGNAYDKASDAIDVITEAVVSSPDILADMIADSTVGQYWSDFWDLEVDSVNAIGGLLEDTAEELANDEDVPGFIRDYMNGFIGADVPYTRWGEYGARFRGAGNSLSGMWKGISSMLGHPCQTEDNIVNAFIMAGDATKYAVHNPANAVNMVEKMADNWWNSKNTYEKISAEWEFLTNVAIMAATWEASAGSAGSKTAEFAETTTEAGEIAAEAGEAGGIVGSEGVAAVERAAGEAAGAIEGAAGKGKIRIESAGESGNYSSLRDLMSPEEVKRYDEHWLDVAEKISDEALDNQIEFIKNGGITKPGGGAYKPAKISAAVDLNNLNTRGIYFGYNGANKFNPSKRDIHPVLQERIQYTKNLAANSLDNPFASKQSFEIWSVDNCAEVYSSNNALLNGVSWDNLFINTKYFKNGEWASPCENCKITFENVYMPKKGN